jgi:GTPase SAR1 family protein
VFKNFKHLFTVSASKNFTTISILGSILISALVASFGMPTFAQSNTPNQTRIDTAILTLIVSPPIDLPPLARDDFISTPFSQILTISVITNDTEPENQALTIVSATNPSNGIIAIKPDKTITYTPNPGFTGTDTFTYTIRDLSGNQDTATVTVSVGPNLPPDAKDDTNSTEFGKTTIISVLTNDTDPENKPLTVISTTTPANGSVVINSDGTITYTPRPGYSGNDTFSYTIRDEAGNQDTATVTVTVRPNLPPDAKNDTNTTDYGKTTTINVLTNDTDPENKPLTIISVTNPSNGTVVINPDGTITYTPRSGFNGNDTFSYTIRDDAGNQDTATVTVTVRPQIIILPIIDNLLRTGGLGGGLGLILLIVALLIYRQSKHKKKIKIDTH